MEPRSCVACVLALANVASALSMPKSTARSAPTARRDFLGAVGGAVLGAPSIAGAFTTDEVMERAAGATNLKGGDTFPLRTYVDPLFDLTFPKDFFAIRRTIDGDIVRRGGVIFTAGQLKTAEIVTVELFKVKELLVQAEALPYFPDGTIRKWSDLGNDKALAEFICERRDKEDKSAAKGQVAKARASQVVPGTLSVKGDVLQADVLTTIGATDARTGEAGTLVKTPGIRRVQRTRLTLLPGGAEIMGVWAGCLDDYWEQGGDEVLKNVVASFAIKAPQGGGSVLGGGA